jgi:hypothetical protein
VEDKAMMTATFNDHTACRLAVVHGDDFEPRPDDRFLFEFPDGTLKEGVVRIDDPLEPRHDMMSLRGTYHRDAKTIMLQV